MSSITLQKLHQAVLDGNTVEVMQHAHAGNVNYVPNPADGLTLLNIAVSLGHIDVASTLLDRGASHTIPDRHGFVPLHRAVWSQGCPMVTVLLHHGADVLCLNKKVERTPLQLAAIRGDLEICRLLLSPQYISQSRSHNERNGGIEFRDSQGKSALDLAAASGKVDVVKMLSDAGADGYFARIAAEEGAADAKTWEERRAYEDINRLLCSTWIKQSVVSM